MLKKDLLAGSASKSLVGVYHYRITPVHWTAVESHFEISYYGFTNEAGSHGSAELLDSTGEPANLSYFAYRDDKITTFNFYFGNKYVTDGVIEINGVKRDFDSTNITLPNTNDDGTFSSPHDIIHPACAGGKPFEMRVYVRQFSVRQEG